VGFFVVFGVVAQGDKVSLNLHHRGFLNPALLVAQEYPHGPLFGTKLVELAVQHGPRALLARPS